MLALLAVVAPVCAFAASNVTSNFTISPSTIAPGDPATVTILLVNDNSTPASITSISQGLPAGLVVVSAVSSTCGGTSGGVGSGTFTYSGGAIPAITGTTAGTCQIVYTVTSNVASPSSSPLTLNLLGSNVNTSLGTSDNDSAQPLTTLALNPLGGNKSFNPTTFSTGVGGTTTLTISISNANSFTMPGTKFTDDVATMGIAGLTIAATPAPTASGCGTVTAPTISGTQISLGTAGADLAANANCTVTVTLNVPAATSNGTYTNTIPANSVTSTRSAVATDPYPITQSISVQAPAGGGKSFQTQTGTPANSIRVGDNPVLLKITATNTSATNASGDLSLSDTFPKDGSNIPYIVLTPPVGGSGGSIVYSDGCGFSSASKSALANGQGNVALSGGTLAAGASCDVFVWVKANPAATIPAAGVTITNTIPAGGITGAGGAYSNGQPLTGSIVLGPGGAGNSYNITLNKRLETAASGPDIYGGVPGPLQVVAPTNPATTPVAYVRLYFGNTMGFSALSFPSTTAPAGTPSIEDDVDTFNNGSGIPLEVHAGDPITISQDFGDAGACSGLTATNTSTTGGHFTANLTGSIPAITGSTPGQYNRCTFTFPVYLKTGGTPATWVGSYQNNVGLGQINGTAPTYNTDGSSAPASNGGASETTTLLVQTDVGINKSFANSLLGPGGSTTLTLTLSNYGQTAVSGASLQDALPAGMSIAATPNFSSASCGSASVSGTTTLTFSNISIAAATGTPPAAVNPAICTLNVDVTVTGVAPLTFSNTIAAKALTGPVTNSLASNTAQVNMSNLAISASKSFDKGSVYAGETAKMTIHISNPNGINLTKVQFTDALPSGMTFAANPNIAITCTSSNVAGTATVAGNTLSGSGFTLVPGAVTDGCDISAEVQLNTGGTATNNIPIGGIKSFEGAQNTGPISATLISIASTGISKSITPSSVAVGQPATVTVRVANSTNGTVGPIGILDEINPAAGYPGGVIPASPTYLAPPSATWQIVPGSVAVNTTVGGTDGAGSGCALGSNTTVAGTANDKTQLNAISVPANTFCDVTYQVKASAAGLYRNAILQGNVTPTNNGPKVCYNGENPCFVSADLSVVPAGALTVTKTLSPATAGSVQGWQFTVSSPAGANHCDLTGYTTTATTNASGVATFPILPVYTDSTQTTQCKYNVAETAQAGFVLESASVTALTGITLTSATTTNVGAVNDQVPTFTLIKNIAARAAPSDQFVLTISGTPAASPASTPTNTTTGSTTGAQTATEAMVVGTIGNTYGGSEAMAAGSASALSVYTQTVACTNTGPTSVASITTTAALQTGVKLAAGDAVSCTITNTPPPRLTLKKTIASRGDPGDQFDLTIGGVATATASTTGTGLSVTAGPVYATAAGSVTMTEAMHAGSVFALNQYTQAVTCVNATSVANGGTDVSTLTTYAAISAGFAVKAGDDITCTITNTPAAAKLTINKTVVDPAGDTTARSFGFTVNCGSATPAPVPATQTVAVTGAGSGTASVLAPIGASCTVTEAAPAAATAPANYAWDALPPGPFSATVTADGLAHVDFTNTLTQLQGGLTVTKQVTQAVAGYVAGSAFPITVNCVDANQQPVSGFPDSISLASGASKNYATVPSGSVCSATENMASLPAPADPSYVYGMPAISAPVTISSTAGVTLTVQNPLTRNTGSVTVSKTVTGTTAGYVAGSTFPLIVDCKIGAAEVTGYPQTLSVANNGSQTLSGIPATSVCSVTEGTPLPATTDPSYSYGTPGIPAAVTISANGTATLAVTNPLSQGTGSVTVSKTVTGATAGYVAGTTFPLIVDCKLGTAEVSGYPQTVNLANNATQTLSGIPATSVCSVTEGSPLPATTNSFYVYGSPSLPAPVTIAANTTATLAVSNPLTALDPPFRLVKSVTGAAATFNGSFTFNIDCGAAGTFTQTVTLTNATSGSVAISNIPVGTSCTFSEASTRSTPPDGLIWGALPPNQTKAIDGGDVTFVNALVQPPEPVPALRDALLALLGLMIAVLGVRSAMRRR